MILKNAGLPFVCLGVFWLASCRPDRAPEESCNNARVKNVTVVRDVRFGMSAERVLSWVRPDTCFFLSLYPDTSVTFRADLYGVPARWYMGFDKSGLADVQIRTLYGIDPLVDEVWRDSISAIYGKPEKLYLRGSSSSFYLRWILCDGGRATLRSNFIMNGR